MCAGNFTAMSTTTTIAQLPAFDKGGLGARGDVLKEQFLQVTLFHISSFCGMSKLLVNEHKGLAIRLTLNHFFLHRYHF